MKLKDILVPMVNLLEDAREAEALLDQSDTPFSRRAYFRSIFASTEGIIWLLKQVCLTAPLVGGGRRRIPAAEYALLQDQTYDLKNNGETNVQTKFLKLPDNFRFTVRVFNRLFKSDVDLKVGQQTWDDFLKAIEIRNRITHPKDANSIEISDTEVALCRRVSGWMNEVFHSMISAIVTTSKSVNGTAEQGTPSNGG